MIIAAFYSLLNCMCNYTTAKICSKCGGQCSHVHQFHTEIVDLRDLITHCFRSLRDCKFELEKLRLKMQIESPAGARLVGLKRKKAERRSPKVWGLWFLLLKILRAFARQTLPTCLISPSRAGKSIALAFPDDFASLMIFYTQNHSQKYVRIDF